MAGPMIAPTAKNPSTVFIVEVCSCGRSTDVTDQGERPGLKNADRRSGDHEEDYKKHERLAHGE